MPRKLLNASAGTTLVDTLSIYNGGTGATDAATALSNLDGVPSSLLNQPLGPLQLDANGNIPAGTTIEGLSSVMLDGPATVIYQNMVEYKITNFSDFVDYTVTVSAGTAWILGDVVRFHAPASGSTVNLTINGTTFVITIVENSILAPKILAPLNGSSNVGALTVVDTDRIALLGSTEIALLLASDASGGQFGYSVDMTPDGTTIVVGAVNDPQLGTNAGSVYIYKFDGTSWVETKLLASDGLAEDQFGIDVSISSNGLTIVVGSRWNDNVNGTSAGAAYIYRFNGTSWIETKLIASDGAAGDNFGEPVSISNDGLTIVVGSFLDDNVNGADAGAAYVYKFDGTNWIETKLLSSDGVAYELFGWSVDISGDGSTVIIGAKLDNADPAIPGSGTGAAYIYKWNGTTWIETKLLASDAAFAIDQFGWSVAINLDGTTIVVGAIYDNNVNGAAAGAVYVYKYDGTNWIETKLIASDGADQDYFGNSVNVTGDGNTIVVASVHKNDIGTKIGYTYLYRFNGNEWIESKLLTRDDGADGAGWETGQTVAISDDAGTVVRGQFSNGINGARAGAAYIYAPVYHNQTQYQLATDPSFTTLVQDVTVTATTQYRLPDLTTDTTYYLRVRYVGSRYGSSPWSEMCQFSTASVFVPTVELAKIIASDGAAGDQFGWNVSINSDASTIVVGADLDDNINGADAGAVYIYKFDGTNWIETKLIASDGGAGDRFGRNAEISTDGNVMVVGAYNDDNVNGVDAGAVYIYKFDGTNWIETKLIASDGAAYDLFGFATAINALGDIVAVGAHGSDGVGSASGSNYIYKFDGTNWIETKLVASDASNNGQYGWTVSLDALGTTLVTGARVEDNVNGDSAGSAYIYRFDGTSWIETKLLASDGAAGDQFGWNVSINSDASTIVVGAYRNDNVNGVDAGAAYIYKFDGTSWIETKLIANDGALIDYFGASVCISNDGLTIIVGAYGDDTGNNVDSGSSYIYKFDGTNWLETKLTASDGATGDLFGASVSVSSDGLTVMVGARVDDNINGVDAGAIYVYGT